MVNLRVVLIFLIVAAFDCRCQEATVKEDTVEVVTSEPQRVIPAKTITLRVSKVAVWYHEKDVAEVKNDRGQVVSKEIKAGELRDVWVEWIDVSNGDTVREQASTPEGCRALLEKIGLRK